MHRAHVLSGIDRISLAEEWLAGKRVGLMTNPTGIDHQLRSTIDLLAERYHVTALFAVEHGIRGDIQAGEAVRSTVDPKTGIPVFSAYGETSRFTEEMLESFDVLVFDIQDVGARFYTYLYSLSYAMQACQHAGKPVVVLDRINPLGGIRCSGTILDPRFASFVGDYELPTQYALTIGEYARYVHAYLKLTIPLFVVPLEGWARGLTLDRTDLPWVATSPNCPNLETALCYVGTCLFEGTNVSEGRGTTQPFQLIGTPWIDGAQLEGELSALETPGIHFRQTSFCPTFSKHQGTLCHGVQMHILEREESDAFSAGLLLLDTIRQLYPDRFEFLSTAPGRYFIDLLMGTDSYRTGAMDAPALIAHFKPQVQAFYERSRSFWLYE